MPETLVLVCVECGAESEGSARGWRALLALEDDELMETVAIYCASCGEAEFDG